MEEIWIDIIGYEGMYMISNYGNVKSLERIDSLGHHRREKILKTYIDGGGHLYVKLSKNGVKEKYLIHRLVAEAFLPNPEGKSDIHHIDHNPQNNNVDNLIWLSKKEHRAEHPEQYEAIKKALSKHINQFTIDGLFVREWYSAHDIERQFGYAPSNIINCCKGKRKTAYGYIWKYAEDC